MTEQEKVTVVLVTSTSVRDGAPCVPTIRSVEDQTWPNDLHIVMNEDGYDLTQMQRLGAQHADTRLVAFIEEGCVWPEDMLLKLFEHYSKDPGAHGYGIEMQPPPTTIEPTYNADDTVTFHMNLPPRGVIAERDYILQVVKPVRLVP